MDVRNKCQRKKREGGGIEWEEKRHEEKDFKEWPPRETPTLALYPLARKTQWTQGLRIESGLRARWSQVTVLLGTKKGAETGEPE